jgi:hypothetical protein
MKSNCKVGLWTGRVLTSLAIFPFLFSCFMKFMRNQEVLQGVSHLGWPESSIVTLGVLEAACILFYLFPPTAVLGAILLTGYLGGAISTHVRIGEPVIMHVVIGLLIWSGLFLRETRLRELLPTRKNFYPERNVL